MHNRTSVIKTYFLHLIDVKKSQCAIIKMQSYILSREPVIIQLLSNILDPRGLLKNKKNNDK